MPDTTTSASTATQAKISPLKPASDGGQEMKPDIAVQVTPDREQGRKPLFGR